MNSLKFKINKKRLLKILVIAIGIMLGLILLLTLASWGYNKVYQDKVYPGVYIDDYHIGSMSREEVESFAEKINDKLTREGFDFNVEDSLGEKHQLKIQNLYGSTDASIELVSLDKGSLSHQAFKIGRDGDWFANLFYPIGFKLFNKQVIKAPVLVKESALEEVVKASLERYSDSPRDANLKITNLSNLEYEIIEERAGKGFNYELLVEEMKDSIAKLKFLEFEVVPQPVNPQVKVADVVSLAPRLGDVLSYGNLNIAYVDPQTKLRKDWYIDREEYVAWLKVVKTKDDKFIFSFDEGKLSSYLQDIADYINRPAQDAKFEMTSGRVIQFQASRSGVEFLTEENITKIQSAFEERNYNSEQVTKSITAEIKIIEPKVKLADVNDLGITDIIGVGISTFRDSHTNRIKNIANAVKRLNGVLIEPDEEFSTNKYAGPYTLENGFLPEAIIKGDEIKDEVGGGMCQIGTTMFRMAMNSGMEITQRRNHSLVVSYYADPINGNPGTDATLYEPFLDLKFVNDTGNYLLLQTDIDYDRQELKFTLWGKPDGRTGSYTHPKVLQWIPVGEEQEIETEDLEPGERKCQNAFPGAVALFTYTRITPTGEVITKDYESHYRALPKICLVGVDPEDNAEECDENDEECEELPVDDDLTTTSTNM